MTTEVTDEVTPETPAGALIEQFCQSSPSHAAGLVHLFGTAPLTVVALTASSDSESDHRHPAAVATLADEDADEDAATRSYEEADEVRRMMAEADAKDEEAASETSTSAPSQASTSAPSQASSVASASMQATLDAVEGTPYCTKCTYPIEDIFRAKLYGKQSGCPTFICRGCNNLITMVAKHMDLSQLADSGLSFASLQMTTTGEEFFKQDKEAANQHGRLAWNQIRELLTSALTERRMQVVKIKYTDKEWPLSVWVTKGFDAEDLKKNGTRVDHPVFSDVYKAPLKETSRANVMPP